jgi:formate C-acetyltransferase
VIITCDAMKIWSERYAEKAREMAGKEGNSKRKAELLKIADVCSHVPENPSRTLHDALQCQWWGQLFNRIEQTSCSMGQGRMDQYLLPYYRKDIAEGRLTRDDALELLQCVWLHMSQVTEIKMNPVAAAGTEGFSQFCDICLGGVTPDGQDATNELSYLLLESVRPLQITSPDMCVRIHANTPEKFLHAVAETIKDGKGYPKLLNDEFVIPFYLANGIHRKEANNYTISGCCEQRVINIESNVTANGGFNYGSAVEMTFRNGRLKVFKDLKFGKETGDPRQWTSYDQVWRAFLTQIDHLVRHSLTQQFVALSMAGRYFASPQTSMLHDLAMEHCRDLHTHGEWIPGALDHSCLDTIGKATAVDSLAAVKHLIFDTKKLSWDQLLEAIEKNWEGHEATRQLCLNAPKYGNAIDWVDQIAFDIDTFILEMLHRYHKPHDQCFILRCIPITFHVPAGKVTWATPNGRPAHEYLSEGISASHGMDTKGPTATLASMAHGRNGSYREKGGELVNMKFAPGNISGEEGTRRLMHVIRTWSSLKLWHIQFNILNRETLLAAQREPEKYRDLVVRIAGYSAYFVDLSPSQQAEIIARTEEAT